MSRGRAEQFKDAENPSAVGMGSPACLRYESIINQLKRDELVRKESDPTPPMGLLPRRSPPIGRGQMMERTRRNNPEYLAMDIERDLKAAGIGRYNDSIFGPPKGIATKKPEHGMDSQASSSQSWYDLNPEKKESFYIPPVDLDELRKAPPFIMKEDDFPPL